MEKICPNCKKQIRQLNQKCQHCGFKIIIEPNEETKKKYLRGPSLGALFFTQGWAFGARLYIWFILSLIPFFGLIVLLLCFFFGRRWSWQYGGWSDWGEFQDRMKLLDIIAIFWVLGLIGVWYFFHK